MLFKGISYNYLIAATRSIFQNKKISFINIVSLAIGLAVTLLVMLFVQFELTYDRWLTDNDRIFRYETQFTEPGRDPRYIAHSDYMVKGALLDNFSEIEIATHFTAARHTILHKNTAFREVIHYVDNQFLEVFDLPLVEGDKTSVLKAPGSLVISQTTARKYFGAEPAIGKTIEIEGSQDGNTRAFMVAGVFIDIPKNSQLRWMTIIVRNPLNLEQYGGVAHANWTYPRVETYLKLKHGARAA
ncbi:MAG: ABC transporter permease, partial [Kordiimonadaceae bacterium]|nr:ABC transporter permease [Kordiimonadaceae bacterium]